MSRIAYVSGSYVPLRLAAVHIEDRGYQFADGVYEVWAIRQGQLLNIERHFTRLQRSLSELDIPLPVTREALLIVLGELARQNRVQDGVIYLQITRGVAPRDHVWDADLLPVMVATCKAIDFAAAEALARTGVSVYSTPDQRWSRCDIKSVSLLPNVLAKQKAKVNGAYEAWMVDESGFVTEGSSTNAWIVTKNNELVTRQLGASILGGITRSTLMQIAEELQMKVVERPFSLDEALGAKEAFISAATTIVMPVIAVDGNMIADGRPGQLATTLRHEYWSSQLGTDAGLN